MEAALLKGPQGSGTSEGSNLPILAQTCAAGSVKPAPAPVHDHSRRQSGIGSRNSSEIIVGVTEDLPVFEHLG